MIYLREITESDLPMIHNYRNKETVDSLGSTFRFVNMETDQKWYQSYLASRDKNVRCAICMNDTDKAIGVVYIVNIDPFNRTCGAGIIIGNTEYRGKGLGKKALAMAIKHAFVDLGIQRVEGKIIESNNASRKMAAALGFKEEGIVRQSLFKNGEFHNQVQVGLLKEDFIDISET